MTINPRIGVWISIIAAIISTLVLCGAEFTTIFGAGETAKILAGLGILNAIINGVNAVLHMIPSQPGAAGAAEFALGPATPSAPSAAAKVIVLLAVLILGTLALAPPAFAQKAPLRRPAVTGNVINDINTDLHGGTTKAPSIAGVTLTGDITKDGPKIWSAILAANSADLNYAAAMATAANTPASATRLQCLNALIKVNAQASGSSLLGPDGKPLTKPDPHAISDIESVAELVDNLSPQGALYTSCAGAATMFKTNVLALINGIVTGVAAFGATGGVIP